MIGVVDTSVVLKWYVQENDSALARALIGRELAAPNIILIELANALWKKLRKGEIGISQANGGLSHLRESVKLLPSTVLVEEALGLGVQLLHPIYDCVFLVLARELGVPLITSDERLIRRAWASGMKDLVVPLTDWEERNA